MTVDVKCYADGVWKTHTKGSYQLLSVRVAELLGCQQFEYSKNLF